MKDLIQSMVEADGIDVRTDLGLQVIAALDEAEEISTRTALELETSNDLVASLTAEVENLKDKIGKLFGEQITATVEPAAEEEEIDMELTEEEVEEMLGL